MTSENRSQINRERFDQAARNYFSPTLSFFEDHGAGLIAFMGVLSGSHVLDIGCGAGALTMPAAEIVGSSGKVVGTDISSGMLNVARSRAEEADFSWAEFQEANIESLELDEDFEFAVCGFVMQMFTDLTTVPRALGRHVSKEGKVGLSVWANGAWEPHTSVFRDVLRSVRPDLVPAPGNIENLQQPGRLESIMDEAGLTDLDIRTQKLPHRLEDFEKYWELITTVGSRAVLEKMTGSEVIEVRKRLEPAISRVSDKDGSLTVSMAAIYASGRLKD